MTTGECYVCTGLNAPLSSCNCKNMYLHENCQLLVIKKLNTHNCTICKQPYNNINITVKTRYRLTKDGAFILLLIIIFISCMGMGFFEIFIYLENKKHEADEEFIEITVLLFVICFITSGLISYLVLCSTAINMYRNNIPYYYRDEIIIPRLKKNSYLSLIKTSTSRIYDISNANHVYSLSNSTDINENIILEV